MNTLYIVSCYKMLYLYICSSAFRSKKSYCMICMQQLYTYTILFGFHDTTAPKKKQILCSSVRFIINRDPFKSSKSSPSIWRDFHWLQWSITPTVGEAMLQKREDFHGWKVFPNGRSVIWSQQKLAELKFHRPTRHSLRVEKTQLLDVTVEGEIRKLISWIHVPHMCRYEIFISDILQYAYMCRYWIFNKYSYEAPSKGCQLNLNKWRIDTLWESNHLAPSRYI